MRTTLTEHASDRGGHDDQEVARDNPRRQREPSNARADDDRHGNGMSRSPLRHGVEHARDSSRRLART